jgi:hypothetical protein
VGVLGAVTCLGAAAVMGVAAFLPYTGWYGDGLDGCCAAPQQISVRLIDGPDVLFALVTVMAVGLFAAFNLAGDRRRLTGLLAIGASIAALGIALKLPGTYRQDGLTYGWPYLLDTGFYLFLGGAVAAVVGALLVLMASLGASRPGTDTQALPAAS